MSRGKSIKCNLRPAPVINLNRVYPNPFNPKTYIEFFTPKKGMIILEIFDITGRKICDLYKSQTHEGSHKVSWDASSYASGIYYVIMTANNIHVDSRRIVFLK